MAVVINGTTGITTPTESVATTIGVGGATPSASGAGITFPATQSASTNANTLDDYEEGTFTPTFVGTGGVTYGSATFGTYTKIGNLVTFNLSLDTTTLTRNANPVQVGGLPFTASNDSEYYPPTANFMQGGWNKSGILFYQNLVQKSNTTIAIWGFASGTGSNYVSVTYNDMNSTTNWIRLSGSYKVD